MIRLINAFLLFIVLFNISSCSNTQVINVWQSHDFHKKDFKTVLVIGVSASQVNRMVFEQTFAQRLNKLGITAIESTTAIGDDYLNREKVKDYTQKHGINYVLIAYQAGQDVIKDVVHPETTAYVNGSIPTANNSGLAYDFPATDNFWSPSTFVTLRQHGYEEQIVKATLVTTIFQVSTGKKVWSAQSLITDPDSISAVSDQMAKIMLKHMN